MKKSTYAIIALLLVMMVGAFFGPMIFLEKVDSEEYIKIHEQIDSMRSVDVYGDTLIID